MLAAGETEIAVDELRWLLSGCTAFLEGHQLLGEIALAEADFTLARGHFGTAFELGRSALGQGFSGRLPAERAANRPFFESGKGLAWSLKQAGESRMAEEVVAQLLAIDPADPLRLGDLLKAKEYP